MRVDVDGIHVTLGGDAVLEAVDASVDPGSFVGLVGPNGAGKTTLLRTITAALNPDDGDVFVGDDAVHALSSRAASRRLASVPQESRLDFEFTVREVVEMGRHPHRDRFGRGGDDADAVDHALERAEVASLADRSVTTLSGGERQRVLLARALAQDAPVLVLDEPTASLDVNHQVRTLGLVRDLVTDGRTALAAIHDLDLAARFCDTLLLVADGTIVAAGPPADVLTRERLRDAFGADAVVTHNPLTGTPTVTVRRSSPDHLIDAHVHVLGGTNHASPHLPALADGVRDLTVGPVVSDSGDADVARALDLPTVTTPPLSTPDAATREDARRHVEAADVLVVPSGLPDVTATDRLRAVAGHVVEPGRDAPADAVLAAVADALDAAPPLVAD